MTKSDSEPAPSEAVDAGSPRPSTSTQSRGNNRVFFTARDDIVLLREVLVELPYQYKYGGKMSSWSKVANHFNSLTQQTVSGQSCHERTDRLLTHYRSGNLSTLRRRSSLEEQREKESLLEELNNRVKTCSRFRLSARRSTSQHHRKHTGHPYSASEGYTTRRSHTTPQLHGHGPNHSHSHSMPLPASYETHHRLTQHSSPSTSVPSTATPAHHSDHGLNGGGNPHISYPSTLTSSTMAAHYPQPPGLSNLTNSPPIPRHARVPSMPSPSAAAATLVQVASASLPPVNTMVPPPPPLPPPTSAALLSSGPGPVVHHHPMASGVTLPSLTPLTTVIAHAQHTESAAAILSALPAVLPPPSTQSGWPGGMVTGGNPGNSTNLGTGGPSIPGSNSAATPNGPLPSSASLSQMSGQLNVAPPGNISSHMTTRKYSQASDMTGYESSASCLSPTSPWSPSHSGPLSRLFLSGPRANATHSHVPHSGNGPSASTMAPNTGDFHPEYVPRALLEDYMELRQRELELQEKRIIADEQMMIKADQRDREQKEFMEALISRQNQFLEKQSRSYEKLLHQHMDFCKKYFTDRNTNQEIS
ncbi:hypothetical protein BJ085DRAFT_35285 [Dimargaris cristalligena]|uniref:Uncharacterized protein n=1 Tax=Dimargaris cristalligena TaxID=215637 RepID=A0A4Q0A2W8_9FUNG|nr:hypothetical protein BJ085DRAFT_35285 [Dimargaris cristalligena]|eukprot:RKP40188.1 hypothetical protein BJ085DRAFT_35285 [Dimargaris cristalligena]